VQAGRRAERSAKVIAASVAAVALCVAGTFGAISVSKIVGAKRVAEANAAAARQAEQIAEEQRKAAEDEKKKAQEAFAKAEAARLEAEDARREADEAHAQLKAMVENAKDAKDFAKLKATVSGSGATVDLRGWDNKVLAPKGPPRTKSRTDIGGGLPR